MKKIHYCLLVFLLMSAFFQACKKDKLAPTVTDPNAVPTTGTLLDHIKDSVYLFTQEDYLWYDAIPAYGTFKPRSFTGTTDVDALQAEVNALSQYKINPATNLPYEYNKNSPGESKYSFIDQGQVATKLGGTNGDFGFGPFWVAVSDLRIKYVYPGSPADKAGLVRGYQIVKINGNTSLDYDGDAANPTNYNFVINAYYDSPNISMTLKRPDNTTFDVTISTASYTINPVLKSKVIDLGNGKKIGYVEFNTFTVISNAKTYLDAAFESFTTAGVTDVVVDLRYNGGGSVETATYLSNLLVPTAKTGTVMYTEYFSDKLQNDKYPLLAKKYRINAGDFKPANNTATFAKAGSLNIGRVFFIVTGNTASASELTINNLIPELNVQLIGSTTYGKPVGFFAIPISTYQLYVPEFETKNSATQGGYYAGMTPGSATYPGVAATDDVTHDFGDVNEALLAKAIAYVKNGTYTTSSPTILSINASKNQLSQDAIDKVSHDFSRGQVKEMIIDKLPKH